MERARESFEAIDLNYARDVFFALMNPELFSEVPFPEGVDREQMREMVVDSLKFLFDKKDTFFHWQFLHDRNVYSHEPNFEAFIQSIEGKIDYALDAFLKMRQSRDKSSLRYFFDKRYVDHAGSESGLIQGQTVGGVFNALPFSGGDVEILPWDQRRGFPVERRGVDAPSERFERKKLLKIYTFAPAEVVAEVLKRLFRQGDDLETVSTFITKNLGSYIRPEWERAILSLYGVTESLNLKNEILFVPRGFQLPVELPNGVIFLETGDRLKVTGSRIIGNKEIADIEYFDGNSWREGKCIDPNLFKKLTKEKRGEDNQEPGNRRLVGVYFAMLDAVRYNDIFAAREIFRKNDSLAVIRGIVGAAIEHLYRDDADDLSSTGHDCAGSREKRDTIRYMNDLLEKMEILFQKNKV